LECTIDLIPPRRGSVSNSVQNADYSSCAPTASSMCTPVCRDGFTESGAAGTFSLRCDDDGWCDAASDHGNLVCSINSCHGQVWNRAIGANYTSCSSKKTGDNCAPECPSGSTPTGVADNFALICHENGDYDAAALGCKVLSSLLTPP
jgi:hypothetical protein